MSEEKSDMALSLSELNPSIEYCSRVRESRIEQEHDHPENLEIAFILSGHGKYKVNGVTYDVKQGDMIICNPGEKHQSIVEDTENPTLEFVCGFTNIAFAGMEKNQIVTADGSPVIRFNREVQREISQSCYQIIKENYSELPGKEYLMKAQLITILILVYRTIMGSGDEGESTQIESYSKKLVTTKVTSFINENYNKKISLEKIATNLYLSPVYISRIFKEVTGESPINYLIKVRLEKAKELLEGENRSNIKTIAMEVGYDDVYHFSKLFKKYYGISPLYYRKMTRFREEIKVDDEEQKEIKAEEIKSKE